MQVMHKVRVEFKEFGETDPRALDYVDPESLAYVGKFARQPRFESKFKDSTYWKHRIYQHEINLERDPHNERYKQNLRFARNTFYEAANINPAAMYKATSKLCKYDRHIDVATLEILLEWGIKHFKAFLAGSRRISLWESYKNWKKNKSHGFPVQDVFPGEALIEQQWFWDHLEKVYQRFAKADPDGHEFIQQMMTEGLKDEKLNLIRTHLNKIRVFCGSEVFLKIVQGTVVNDFNEKLCSAAGFTWSFCGGNHFYGGWHHLATQLLRHPNLMEFDGSQWDSTLITAFFVLVVLLRWEMFAPEDRNEETWNLLINSYRNVVFTPYVNTYGEVFFQGMGNPSGQNSTITDNTLINFFLMCYCWLKLSPQPDYLTMMVNVFMALCGDDNVMSASDWAIKFFHPDAISAVAFSVGPKLNFAIPKIIRTPKHNNLKCGLLARTFLSKNFVRDGNGFWLPLPTREKLAATYNVVKYDNDAHELTMLTAAQLLGWPDEDLRIFLEDEIRLLLRRGGAGCTPQEWEQAKATHLTSVELSRLYYGFDAPHGNSQREQLTIATLWNNTRLFHELRNEFGDNIPPELTEVYEHVKLNKYEV